MRSLVRGACAALAVALSLLAATATRAEWMQPDATYRDAQLLARSAARDTVGRSDDVGRLDTLAVALLRLGRLTEAEALFRRALALQPGDAAAMASLGKLALFANRLDEAEGLLAPARGVEGAIADLYTSRVRRSDWLASAKYAEDAGEPGRRELHLYLASPELEASEQIADAPGKPAYTIAAGPEQVSLSFKRTWPVPLVQVKLNGESVWMAVDVGLADCLVDESFARRTKLKTLPSQRTVLWNGARTAVTNTWLRDVEIGGYHVQTVPAGVVSLRRYSLVVNPQAPVIGGVIGANLLRRFECALDFRQGKLELAKPGHALAVGTGAATIPFQWWGEAELMVQGTLNGGRKMWMMLGTGLPGGVGAAQDVFDEVGVKPGSVSRALKGAGSVLQGHGWAGVGVPAATVGTIAVNRLSGWSGAFDPAEMWRHGARRDALLGPELWKNRRVVFDWKASVLRVEGE